MTKVLIVGSGPAAAGAALGLCQREDVDVTIIDIGMQLEAERQELVDTLAGSQPADWDAATVAEISTQPVSAGTKGLPEKRRFGSDYPFRNFGQRDGVTTDSGSAASLISAAYGGFSTVWGSQLMPFSASTFDAWPVAAREMHPHYASILERIPFAGEEDDLAANFPLLQRSAPLPKLSARSEWVLDSYGRHRATLNKRGITMGKARLAFDATNCVRCGLCMTGCPYELIYSAPRTLDPLFASGRVKRHSGLLAIKVVEESDRAVVVAKELATGRLQRFEADRVFIACGAMGSTRLIANSLGLFDIDLTMGESQQFVLPMLSRRAGPDPRLEPDFTLNQFNMVVAMNGSTADVAQLHFYTFNPAFSEAMPAMLRRPAADAVQSQLLRRLTVALGYFPSWRSPRLAIRARKAVDDGRLPDLRITAQAAPIGRREMLRSVVGKLVTAAPRLDLYPVLPMLRVAAAAKSYHWGGSFPHQAQRNGMLSSDRLGRVGPWQRIHTVDASVFPTVPAMTFTLTIMANAHRIADETLGLAA